MKAAFLLPSNEGPIEKNIYADKSSLILDWLLRKGLDYEFLSIRESAKEIGVSIGLTQQVFETLVLKGLLEIEGIRTAKKFTFKKPELLISEWIKSYSLVKKCKMWTYRSAFQDKAEFQEALKKANLNQKVALALHSSAESYNCKNTNLNTFELYMLVPSIRSKLESVLQLEPQERGYEVLLIEPYYKSLLRLNPSQSKIITASSPLLTFLDLYHFPLRGQEQAEFMAERIPELKRIYNES